MSAMYMVLRSGFVGSQHRHNMHGLQWGGDRSVGCRGNITMVGSVRDVEVWTTVQIAVECSVS